MDIQFKKSTVEEDPLVMLNEVLAVMDEQDIQQICFLYMDQVDKCYLYAASNDSTVLSKLALSGYIFINSFDPREYTIFEEWMYIGNVSLLN